MGHDDDGELVAQLVDQFLDLRRRNRVKRRARLIHQDHFGADSNRARDAQTLLLAARKPGARLRQPVLDLIPQARAFQ